MTESERMRAGALYYAGDEALSAARLAAKELIWRYNATAPADWEGRTAILRQLLGHLGEESWIETPFRCDYGSQIRIGDHFFANYDCIFLDVASITIGDHVFFGPRVCLYTAGHPTVPEVRDLELEFGSPIVIGNSVWIGGNTVVLPGVSIGSGTVVAAGSVVTRDLPEDVLAAGNPCKVLRALTEGDRAKWETLRAAYEADS
ncbi:sugar O-acetyltransferase [Oscillibacter sp.]|uniref:sugar O-acetyltransferase n=1 Tax=Oscillibacter sp. TaxID=1945593 RepID=UPI00261E9C13|nr:sugar O-acetyltransferase [Oscillibacter sp.]MDD3347802.1 sugar O-acetyltransferase [Oscillibacter sp.]